jgi:7-carboxy-7-deazaguanine synthase
MEIEEKPIKTASLRKSLLPLMEQFYTIQGEGFYTGTPAYFIRLAGCDVGCVWCDVKESWDAAKHKLADINDIVSQAVATHCKTVVITGGEPLMNNLDKITKLLAEKDIKTHVETSGTSPLSGFWHWICFSPKKFKKPLEEYYKVANELKVVIYNKSDMEWAETHAAKVNPNCKLFLQPEWTKREKITPILIDYIKQNPKWNISLQTHKFLNIP